MDATRASGVANWVMEAMKARRGDLHPGAALHGTSLARALAADETWLPGLSSCELPAHGDA